MALQCDIAQQLTKATIPSKANATSVTIKSEPKPAPVEEKPKEKKEDTSEMSLEANEKMIIDDDVSGSVEGKNERYVFTLMYVKKTFK